MKAYNKAPVIYGPLPEDFFEMEQSYRQLVAGILDMATGAGDAAADPHAKLSGNEITEMNAAISDIILRQVPFPGKYLTDIHSAKARRADAFNGSGDPSGPQAEIKRLNDPGTYVTRELMDCCIADMKTRELYSAASLLAERKNELFR